MTWARKCLKTLLRDFMYYFKYSFYLFVIYTYSIAHAGSYEDFFAAIPKDDEATVRSLLARGFDVNTLDPKGQHGLLLAARHEATKVANVLLQVPKVKVESRNAADESPLMLASLNGMLDVVRRLVALGADVNKPGWAPLHYAATKAQLPVMRVLLENHAYIDASSPNGTTPLMMAAFYGSPSAVKLLLEEGADPSLKNDQSLTAIDFAHRNNRQDSADIIAAFVRARQPKGTW